MTHLSMLAVGHTAKHLTNMDNDFVVRILPLLVICQISGGYPLTLSYAGRANTPEGASFRYRSNAPQFARNFGLLTSKGAI